MSARCLSLMVSLRDSSEGLEGSKVVEIADEIEVFVVSPPYFFIFLIQSCSIIHHISRKVNDWGSWNHLKSLLSQREIKDGIDRLHREIDAAMIKFNVRTC